MLFNTREAHYEWFDDNTCSSQPLGSFDLFEDKYESAPAFALWSFGIKKDYDHNKGFGQKTEGYTDCLSWDEALNVIGDGWTIDVICAFFKNIEAE